MKKDASIYSDLISSLKTTQEVADFVCEIDNLTQTFFKAEKISLEEALSTINVDSAEKIRQAFAKSNLDINDRDAIAGFFVTLKELLQKFKVIKLVLAFCLTKQAINNLHNFVKETIGTGYILDIEILDEVLGGAIVIYNGKYADFTLKKDLEDAFKTKQSQILSHVG